MKYVNPLTGHEIRNSKKKKSIVKRIVKIIITIMVKEPAQLMNTNYNNKQTIIR